MKFLKLAFAMALALAYGDAYAFHSGGVAECEGCHSMHNSFEGKANVTGMPQFQSGPYLLKAADQSGACLNCHNSPDTAPSGYHISTDASKLGPGLPPVEMTPGGDFAWLKKTYNYFVRGSPSNDDGDRHGHNIVAVDYGYTPDKTQTVAPGGTYLATSLACSSCHDPHGRYRRDAAGNVGTSNGLGPSGNPAGATVSLPIFNSGSYATSAAPIAGVAAVGVYRILGGIGYSPRSQGGLNVFTANPPIAVAPGTYNRSEATTQTVVAYGQGMSEWCGNCHGNIHLTQAYVSGQPGLRHPADNNAHIPAAIVANYQTYVSSGRMTGIAATSYSTLAPFETGDGYAQMATLQGYAVNDGSKPAPVIATTSNVMCLSCHRAHASGFESMTRFFTGNEFMTIADASNNAQYDPSVTEGKINWGRTVVEQQAAYYGRPAAVFGPYARNYCNKCHAKD
jgi:hypothetical protein